MFDKERLAKELELFRVKSSLTKTSMAAMMCIPFGDYVLFSQGRIPDHRIKMVCDYIGIKVEDVLEDK